MIRDLFFTRLEAYQIFNGIDKLLLREVKPGELAAMFDRRKVVGDSRFFGCRVGSEV